jgi:cyanobactin maturation PatA/PatG family protease
MATASSIPGIKALWGKTIGDPRVRIAILDGPVDLSHPCFAGAKLKEQMSHLRDDGGKGIGPMTAHGTHVASVIFGRHGSPVAGIAPGCSGMTIPVFTERRRRLSQLDLSRAIEAAVQGGAHVINISGGQLTNAGEAEKWLEHAIQLCADNNVLVVAAAGNDGCQCLHVPAALPTVLAVGAMDDRGNPVEFSNWGQVYQAQGILAPGSEVLGARPGGGTAQITGTSMAAPIVSGIAGLLLSLQLDAGREPDPGAVRAAILHGAVPCDASKVGDCSRFLVGTLSVSGAEQVLNAIERKEIPMLEHLQPVESTAAEAEPAIMASCRCEQPVESGANLATGEPASDVPVSPASSTQMPPTRPTKVSPAANGLAAPKVAPAALTPSQTSSELTYVFQPAGGLVYALGTLGFDFGTEARRDSFKQLMGAAFPHGYRHGHGPIPHDARDIVIYLKYLDVDGTIDENKPSYAYLDEAKSLIWTLNLELTPIYGLEPLGPFSLAVYKTLVDLLDYQTLRENHPKYVERVSIPGLLAGRTVRLFSGQVLPIIELENNRGLYGWKVNDLVTSAITAAQGQGPALTDEQKADFALGLTSFLNRIYYDFRNLGTTAPDRALNFSVTNLVQASMIFGQVIRKNQELDSIEVLKSPTCRLDSDCWDVKLKFFHPGDLTKAVTVARFTVDVSDKMPVTLGSLRTWAQRY